MLAFMKVLQPKTVEEAYELATKNKTAPMLAGGCWLRLGRRTWPSVIDMASLDLRYVREEDKEFVIGAMATQVTYEIFANLIIASLWIFAFQINSTHHHASCTKTTLICAFTCDTSR